MNHEVSLSWKVLLPLSNDTPDYAAPSKLFNIRSGKSFIRKIGGIETSLFLPIVLEPTVVFHNALNQSKKAQSFTGKKFPYTDKDGNQVNINIRLYFEKYIVLTISILQFIKSDPERISVLQNLKQHKELYSLAQEISGLIIEGDYRDINPLSTLKIYPCIGDYLCESSGSQVSDKCAVEILTRHSDPRDEIVQKVISKNRVHQINTSNILVDKQGIYHRVPYSLYQNNEVKRKFLSSCNLLELSMVFRKLLADKNYVLDSVVSEQLSYFINHPDVVICNSVTARKTWELLIQEFNLLKIFQIKRNSIDHETDTVSSVKPSMLKNIVSTTEFKIFIIASVLALFSYIYITSLVLKI